MHSTTKYVGGHSDVVGGAVVVRDLELAEKIGFHQNAMGAVAGPFDAFLTHRGLKTLGVRMDRHCDNAERIVEFLDGDPRVTEVIYPGLAAHPGHEVAARQMKRFGGMISLPRRRRRSSRPSPSASAPRSSRSGSRSAASSRSSSTPGR